MMSGLKNILVGINSRFEATEERIRELEETIVQNETHRKKTGKNLVEHQWIVEKPQVASICIIGAHETEEVRKKYFK